MPLILEKELEGLGRRYSRLFGMKRWKNNAHTDKAMKIWLQVYFPSRFEQKKCMALALITMNNIAGTFGNQ